MAKGSGGTGGRGRGSGGGASALQVGQKKMLATNAGRYQATGIKGGGVLIQSVRQSNYAEIYEKGAFRKAFQKRGFTEKERAIILKALNS